MSADIGEENYVFHSITDKQAVLTQERISSVTKTTFPALKSLYAQYSEKAMREKDKEPDDETRDYDESIAQLLSCEYHLRKLTDKKAVEFVDIHKPRYNFTFDLVNEDIDELNRKIDDPTFDWPSLKNAVASKEAENTAVTDKEVEEFQNNLAASFEISNNSVGVEFGKSVDAPTIKAPTIPEK